MGIQVSVQTTLQNVNILATGLEQLKEEVGLYVKRMTIPSNDRFVEVMQVCLQHMYSTKQPLLI